MRNRIIAFSAIAIAGILVAGFMIKDNKENPKRPKDNILKVINPYDVNPDLVDDSIKMVRTGHTVADFNFVNQYGDSISQANLDNKIYVANYFFTTCGGICPKMNEQFKRIQEEFKSDDWLMLLSHTVWPEGDSIQRLYDYSLTFEAIPTKWWFLTGTKKELYTMARKSYLVVPDENNPDYDHGSESDFIHTENFVLVDPKKQIRGMYDGTNPDEVAELIKDIYDLKREFKF
jgi:protein SCO1/2